MTLDLSSSRVAVTGAAGLIGRSLLPKLLAAGADVVAIDVADVDVDDAGTPGSLEVVTADVRERERLREVVAGCDGVAHLASILTFACEQAPIDGFDINVASTIDVLEAASRREGTRVVLASSIGTYGPPPSPDHVHHEDDPLRGVSQYATSKIVIERYGAAFAASRGLSSLWLRFGSVYGPWQAPHHVVPRFLVSVLDDIEAGRTPVVEFEPDGQHDLVFVDDAAEAVVRALTCEADNQPVNVVTGVSRPLKEVFAEVLDLYGSDATIDWRPGSSPVPKQRRFDPSRAREVLGYSPDTPLRDGLAALQSWRAEHRPAAG